MGHTYSNILIHVIFSTKHRKPSIREDLRPRLHEYLAGIARNEFGRTLKIGGTDNHIHSLLSLNTDVAIADAMCRWKSLSSGWIHQTFPDAADFAWQSGYGAFSVSQSNAAKVIAYIEDQLEHHRTRTFEEEFIEFLERHKIEYDPRYVWD